MGSSARTTIRVVIVAWVVVPLSVLAIAVAAGRSSIADASALVVWLALPWLVVLANLWLIALVLEPGVRRRTDRNGR